MTICIALICKCDGILGYEENSEVIVFATDHMITLPEVGEFEHTIEKCRKVNHNTIAMLSGEALLFDDVLDGTNNLQDFDGIRDKIHENMNSLRNQRIESYLLDRFNIRFEDLGNYMQLPQHNNILERIMNEISNVHLKTSVLLAGYKNNRAEIVEINEITYINTRDINFNAIGSGGTQAINTLLFQSHTKDDNLRTALYNVFKAKKNSEVASGVGRETVIGIMFEDGHIYELTNENILVLNDIYIKETSFGKSHGRLSEIL